MAKFKFPDWRELSKDEQIPIVNLSTDKTYFVRGGPGTGKSILAIHRIAKVRDQEPNANVKLLVYNKALQLHLADALTSSGLDRSVVQTCHSWIYELTGLKPPPKVWNYDWQQVADLIGGKTDGRKFIDHLVVDESQDLPKPLLHILHSVAVNATIFVDDKQAINAGGHEQAFCKLTEIRAVFDAGTGRTFDLTKNFRNTQQILNVALAIRPDEDGEISDAAIRQDGPRPMLRQASLDQVVERIETYHANNPVDSIGVAMPRSRQGEIIDRLESSEVPCQLYTNSNVWDGLYHATFEGATVLAHDVMKGLEFDAVFIPLLEHSKLHDEATEDVTQLNQNLVYVMSTRARNVLEYSHAGKLPDSWLTRNLRFACEADYLRRV